MTYNIQPLQPASTHRPFLVSPANITEAMEYSRMISESCFCPSNMRGKPGDVLVAIQMGAEVGLSPIQALQNINVINSRPTIWGDAVVALVQNHPRYVSHDEWFEGSVEKGDMVAFCSVTRKGSSPHVRQFSIDDAKRARLWGKPGTWQQYPDRMLQMRARAFAFRDKFADALKGLQFREEVEDYAVVETPRKVQAVTVDAVKPEAALKHVYEGFIAEMLDARNELVLKNIWDRVKSVTWVGTDYLQKLAEAKDSMKMEIKKQVSSERAEPAQEYSIQEHAEFIAAMDSAEVPNEAV